MPWGGADRRQFPRADYECVVRIRHKGGTEEYQTKTENIGCGGICVLLPKELKIFSQVEVELKLGTSNEPIKCDGTVVWSVERSKIDKGSPQIFDIGVEFVNLNARDRARIEQVVAECLSKQA